MLLFDPHNHTSFRVPTTSNISYSAVTFDRPGGGGQIPGRIKISSTLSYFHNSISLSLSSPTYPPVHDTSTSRLGYNNNNTFLHNNSAAFYDETEHCLSLPDIKVFSASKSFQRESNCVVRHFTDREFFFNL